LQFHALIFMTITSGEILLYARLHLLNKNKCWHDNAKFLWDYVCEKNQKPSVFRLGLTSRKPLLL
jgi:hypothetical protein